MFPSKKGFFFIEGSIMVVLAGVGVLSAALFPAMTGYLERSRDTARTSHIRQVSTLIQTYYLDKGKYPETPSSGCLPKEALKEYIQSIPIDPTPGHISTGCDGSDGMTYTYTSYTAGDKSRHYILGATMEGEKNGNSSVSISELDISDTGSVTSPLIRGSGKEYIILN